MRRVSRSVRIATILLALAALTFTAAGAVLAAFSQSWVPTATVDDVRQEGVVYRKDINVFLVSSGDEIIALSGRNPRFFAWQTRVLYCRSADAFIGYHGSIFDRTGHYRSGPALRGMSRVTAEVRDGLVYVDPADVRQGPERGVRDASWESPRMFCHSDGPEGPPGFFAE